MPDGPRAVGIDFGTTNSAVAVADGDAPARLARFNARGRLTPTFRSLLFFDLEDGDSGPVRAAGGAKAITRYLRCEDQGRLVQSLKSFLAARNFSSTSILGA